MSLKGSYNEVKEVETNSKTVYRVYVYTVLDNYIIT